MTKASLQLLDIHYGYGTPIVRMQTVESSGDERCYFKFTGFKVSLLKHIVANTVGGTDVFH